MPRYEFSCPVCGQQFEKDLPMNADQAGVRCPACHSNVRRVYSAHPIVFKGSGFYVTDHRPSGASNGGGGKP